jgi:hypothetical protein
MLVPSKTAAQHYLELLCAADKKQLEDRIVTEIATAVREQVGGLDFVPPVRLSTVAENFGIRPKPQVITGNHDGEITFDEESREFVIRLCYPHLDISLGQLGKSPRFRFTYAHELAHRFFFVQWKDSWKRALDITTKDLASADQFKEQLGLRLLEEGLCNNIARRILIPDEMMEKYCDITTWFKNPEYLFENLSTAASRFCVSRDCLLLRLEKSGPRKHLERHCAIIIGSSAGNVTAKGKYTLRVRSGIFAHDARVGFYPGVRAEQLGDKAHQFIVSCFAPGTPGKGRVCVAFRIGQHPERTLNGWWRVIGQNYDKRLILWGQFD